jgi:hypothetical protein
MPIVLEEDSPFPNIPDPLIMRLLTETQQKVWGGLARYVGERGDRFGLWMINRLAEWTEPMTSEFDDLLGMSATQRERAGDEVDGRNVRQQPEHTLTVEEFDQWVASARFDREDGVAAARGWLEELLKFKLDDLGRACSITAVQYKRVELAGRGDIKRFFDQITEKRRKLHVVPSQEALDQLLLECRKLQYSFGEQLFGDGSIVSKIIPKTLTAEQLGVCRRALRESTRFAHRARVDLVLQSLDIVVGLTDVQRLRLTELLLENTLPLAESPPAGAEPRDDFALTLAQAARLPDAKFRTICDNSQWRALSAFLEHVRDDGE